MGNSIIPPTVATAQRIQPTPGSSGRRNRKGTISVYCESSLSIHTFKLTPTMTIKDLKSLLPLKHCTLHLHSEPLPDNLLVQQLDIESNTLIRMIVNHSNSIKSSSTTDSSQEPDCVKNFGPRQKMLEKIEQPDNQSVLSVGNGEDLEIAAFLKAFAVPDVRVRCKERKEKKKKSEICN